MTRIPAMVILLVLVQACARVPRESVELSATVGRDLASVHAAHRELAQVLFSRMRQDVNRFVDGVYAPFQIRRAMARQAELARSTDQEARRKSLFLAICSSLETEASSEEQAAVLQGMSIMVLRIRQDIDKMRAELLDTLRVQESEVVGSIDRAYQQLHYANSIVNGHLASVVKVHDAQDELLRAVGVERDLRKDVAENLAKASTEIGTLVVAAESADQKLELAEDNASKLKNALGKLKERLDDDSKEN